MLNQICDLFSIQYPIIQAGMVWVSGAKLAAAVSDAGGLGLIGAGSMDPDLFHTHIRKARRLTDKPVGVNIPIFSRYAADQVETALKADVRIFFMSAGSPRAYTERLKREGRVVVHVTSTPTLAAKCEAAGVDAVVVEGFEAGGHNGRDELTSFTLIPMARDKVDIPIIAAGGIADGRGIAAALMLGADGVQIGTRFAVTRESSAADAYKNRIVESGDTETALMLKSVVPVRLVRNKLTEQIAQLESRCASPEELQTIVGKGAARRAIFEGHVETGEVEAGQCSGLIRDIPGAAELVESLLAETRQALSRPDIHRWLGG